MKPRRVSCQLENSENVTDLDELEHIEISDLASLKILKICRRSSREPAPSSFSWAGVGTVELVIIILSEPPSSELKPESKKRETKKGRMESTSTMLRESIRKAHFWGAPANLFINKMDNGKNICDSMSPCHLRKYSSVNQAMQMVSISDSQGCSMVSPAMLVTCHHHHHHHYHYHYHVITWRAGSVLITIPTIETNTKLIEMMETTLM